MADKIEDGGPAFPQHYMPPMIMGKATGDLLHVATGDALPVSGFGSIEIIGQGISARDYFAAAAISKMIDLSQERDGGWSTENVAAGCYNLADAMLKAREAK